MADKTPQIPGWFNFQDIYLEAVAVARPGGILVEVGCWFGRSTAYLARAARDARKDLHVVAVDTWRGTDGHAGLAKVVAANGGDIFPAWQDNMKAAGASDMIWPMRQRSVEAARSFADQSLDFVFIDADHSYRAVRADIAAWLPKVRTGGLLSGHDYDRNEVRRAVTEALGKRVRLRRPNSWSIILSPASA